MDSTSYASSEEELLRLRNEGKISEAEYGELLKAMHKPSPKEAEATVTGDGKNTSKQRLGKIALCLMVAGIVLPTWVFLISFAISSVGGLGEMDKVFSGCLVLCILLELPAFIFGVNSWPDAYGKATVITLSVVVGFIVLLFSVTWLWRVESSRTRRDKAVAELQGAREAQRMQEQVIRRKLGLRELKLFPLDDMQGLITRSGLRIDKAISSDGNGSLRIDATEATTIRLFETGDIDIENARLIYQAKVRTENMDGQAYLEMVCHFPGKGDFFSKGLMNPLSGTTDWVMTETPFILKMGENPDNVKLNLVINGKGTVWIDDIRLLKGPLI